MDTTTLVSDLTEDGRRTIEYLIQNGFEVTAAFWLKPSEEGEWFFYVVSPLAEPGRLSEAYSQLFTLIRQRPEPHWLAPFKARLLGPDDPIGKDVLAIRERHYGPKTSPIRWNGNILGRLSVDGAYIYPMPAMVAS